MIRHPHDTLSPDCRHTDTDTYYGNSNGNEHPNGKGKGIAKGKGLRSKANASASWPLSETAVPMAKPQGQNHPDATIAEIMRLRQQPAAYLLLAFLRHEYQHRPYFELPVEAIAKRLCRTPRTIRTARDALLKTGDLAPYHHKRPEPAGPIRGRRPSLYAIKDQGSDAVAI